MLKNVEHCVSCLRTFAVLFQRRFEITWETEELPMSHRDKFSVTIRADQVEFWRASNEIHGEKVKRDGDAWLRDRRT